MLKIAWRYVVRNKKRTFISILGIAFSVMLMFSLIQMGDCIIAQFSDMVTSGMKRDFTIRDLSYDELLKAQQIMVEEGLENNFMTTMNVAVWREDGSKPMDIIGGAGDIEYFKDAKIIEGNYPEKKYEVCIEKYWNDSQKEPYQIGDKFKASLENEDTGNTIEAEFVVSGILTNDSDGGNRIWTSLETANEIQKLLGQTDNVNNAIAVVAVKGESASEKAMDLVECMKDKLALDNFYKEHLLFNDAKSRLYEDEGGNQSMANGVKSITIILGICMIIFVFNSYHISAIEKMKQFAAMRSIGMSKKQQNKILVFEGLILGNVGVLLGFFGGNVLNYFFAKKIVDFLFLEDMSISLKQLPISYVETYVLAMLSIFVAMGKVIWNLRKCTIMEALRYTEEKKKKEGKGGAFKKIQKKKRSLLWQIASRNLQRNPSKSNTLLLTIMLSIVLTLVLVSAFFSIDLHKDKWSKENMFRYEVYSMDSLVELSQEFCQRMRDIAGTENIYTETLCLEMECKDIHDKGVITLVYNDTLFGLLLEANGIKGWEYESQPYAVLFSEEAVDKNSITALNDVTNQTEDIAISKNITEGENYVNSNFGYGDYNFLILNETMAKQLDISKKNCTGLLIKESRDYTIGDLRNNEEEYISEEHICIEDMDVGSEKAKEQLLGMVLIAGYIMLATISLTCVIVSSTIQSNIVSRKKEFAVMSAIGLTKKKNIKICCMENLILFGEAYLIGAVIATGINIGIGTMLDDGIKWNPFIYIGVAVFFATIVVGMAFHYMKKQLKVKLAELLKED